MHPILIILTVIAAVFATFAIFCMVMVQMVYKKMFGYHFKHDPLVTTYTAEGVGVTKKPIEFKIKEKTVRGGLYSPASRPVDSSVLILLCHGMWSSHLSYMQEIGYLCSEGFEVLAFDYIGTADSDGKTLVGFGQSLRCLDGAVKYVKSSASLSNRRLWVFGHSWGGYAATNIAKFHPDIKGIVAIAPAASFDAVIRNVFPKSIHFLIPAAMITDKIRMGRFANQNAAVSLEDYSGKALFIHSKDDPMCPFESTTGEIKNKYGDKFDYIVMDDKAHNPQYTYEGLALMREYNSALKNIQNDDERNALKRATDFIAMGALDADIMDKITAFIRSNN